MKADKYKMKHFSVDADYPRVSDAEAAKRLVEYAERHGTGPHTAATLAEAIWPGRHWRSAQGQGGAASRVLKRVGWEWRSSFRAWGWVLAGERGADGARAK